MSTVRSRGNVKAAASPFLRWAGGKRWLVHKLPEIVGAFPVQRYHEPFLGGGSIFLGLNPAGRSYLSDLNSELIETYLQVRDHPVRVAHLLTLHPNTSEHYYLVRGAMPGTAVERAARFIFLNQTSFNGIYRVNLKGQYNVPFGNREWARMPSEDELVAISKRLSDAKLAACDFATAIERVEPGDLVFLDPPYTVAHNHNGFVKYNQKLFSFEDQCRLKVAIQLIRDRSAFYILTNAAHRSIADLFASEDRKLEVTRRNTIGGINAGRGTATELLFTNLPTPR